MLDRQESGKADYKDKLETDGFLGGYLVDFFLTLLVPACAPEDACVVPVPSYISSSALRAVGSNTDWWKACLLVRWILEGPYDEGAAYVGAASWTVLLPICENNHFELVAINVPVRGVSERSTLVYTSLPGYHKRTINHDSLLETFADSLCDVVNAMPKLNARSTLEWLKTQKSVKATTEGGALMNAGRLISLQNSFN